MLVLMFCFCDSIRPPMSFSALFLIESGAPRQVAAPTQTLADFCCSISTKDVSPGLVSPSLQTPCSLRFSHRTALLDTPLTLRIITLKVDSEFIFSRSPRRPQTSWKSFIRTTRRSGSSSFLLTSHSAVFYLFLAQLPTAHSCTGMFPYYF